MNSYVAALLDELDGVVRAGKTARAAAIRAELARRGYAVTGDDLPAEVEVAQAVPAPERAVARRRRG